MGIACDSSPREGSKPDTQAVNHPVPTIQDTETPAQRDARMQWWREARFGMFIHWGLYSIPAGEWHGQRTTHIGEWIMNDLSIPVADYKAFAKDFNPTGFSAHERALAGLGRSFQDGRLYPGLTVTDAIAVAPNNEATTSAEIASLDRMRILLI